MEIKVKRIILSAVVLSIFIVEFLLLGGWGVAVPIVVIVYYAFVFFQVRPLGLKSDIRKHVILIPIVLTAVSFMLFDNRLLKVLNTVFLYGLIIVHTGNIFGIIKNEFLSTKWFIEILSIALKRPLEYIDKPINIVSKNVKDDWKDNLQQFGKIIFGLIIGLPIVFIIVILLMNSDLNFENLINNAIRNIRFDFDLYFIINRVVLFSILFFILCGFFYGLTYKKESKEKEMEIINKQLVDYTVIITVTLLISMVYFIYLLTQFTYFISAFKGVLPGNYTFSAYARRGFFECIPLSMINLILIAILSNITEVKDSKNKKLTIKIFILYLLGVNLFIVITALSKMGLYISAYGITIMRVYVAWFLVLLSIVLVLISVKIIVAKFKFIQSIFIVFTVMFLGLNYSNVDYRIAKYNLDLYLTKNVDTLGSFNDLSISALQPLYKIAQKEKDYSYYRIGIYLNEINSERKWQSWNLEWQKAKDYISNIK